MSNLKVKMDTNEWSADLEDDVLYQKPLMSKPVARKGCLLNVNYVLAFVGVATLIVTCSSVYMYRSYRYNLNHGSKIRNVMTPTFEWFDDRIKDPVMKLVDGDHPGRQPRRLDVSNSVNAISGLRDGANPVVSGSMASVTNGGTPNSCAAVETLSRLDCHPQPGANEASCSSRGCCWSPRSVNTSDMDADAIVDIHDPNYHQKWKELGTPECFYPQQFTNYDVDSVARGKDKLMVTLKKNVKTSSGYPKDVKNVLLEVTFLCNKRIRIKITDRDNQRFEVPLPVLNIDRWPTTGDITYAVDVTDGGILTVTRKSSGVQVIKSDLKSLIFADQFIQLTNLVPSKELFGIGEHLDTFKKELNGYKR